MKPAGWTGFAVVAGLLLAQGAAQAQTQRSGGGEAQKFMQQYQQIAAEKTALQGQLDQAKKDLEQAKAELAGVKKERDQLKLQSGSAAQADAARAAAEKTNEQYKERLNDIVGRFRDMAQNLKTVERERDAAQQQLTARNAAFDRCADDNTQLADISSDVLDRYAHAARSAASNPLEPFTRLTRTRIENLVDEYRARAQELRVKADAH